MEGGIFMLTFLSLTMLLGSFLSGLLPLTLNLTESKMRHITILGAGLLIGTALAVIIPEGIHTLYSHEKCSNLNLQEVGGHHVHKRDLTGGLADTATMSNQLTQEDRDKLEMFLYSLSKDSLIKIDKRSVETLTDQQLLDLFLAQLSVGNRNNKVSKRFRTSSSSKRADQKETNLILNDLIDNPIRREQFVQNFQTYSNELDRIKLKMFLYSLSKDSLIKIDKRDIVALTDEQLLELFLNELSVGNRNKDHIVFAKRMSDQDALNLFLSILSAYGNLAPLSDESNNNNNSTNATTLEHIIKKRDLGEKNSLGDIKNDLKADSIDKIGHVGSEEKKEEDHLSESSAHSAIGVTLILGFVFMLLVDQIGGKLGHRSHQILDTQSIRNKITFSTTLGLIVHAAADGIALGAAAATSKTDVEMIVFFAIMLHKAPASFGLVSFLIHEGLDRARVRRHLIVFSMAAPVMAILTYAALKSNSTVVSSDATGLCMLFSAGTFLYVSTVHVLPEVQSHNEDRQFKLAEMFSFIVGSLIPLFLSIGHSH